MSNVRAVQLQFALFFDRIEDRPDKFIYRVDDALGGIFDQMPTIIPVPPDAPPEIPTVNMQSSNGLYLCNIARNRIDLIVNCMISGDSVSVAVDKFINKIRPFAEVVFSQKTIVRFGFVGRYFFKTNDAANMIKNKYFKVDLGSPEELSIRFNRRFQNGDLTFNDVIEINKGGINENNIAQQNGIIIQRDLNNMPVGSLGIEDIELVIRKKMDDFKASGILELIQ